MPPLKGSTRLLINLKTNAVEMSPADCERFMGVVELLEFWEKREKGWNKEFRAKEREERKKEEERRLLLQELLQEEKENEAERQLLQELIQEEKEKEQNKTVASPVQGLLVFLRPRRSQIDQIRYAGLR